MNLINFLLLVDFINKGNSVLLATVLNNVAAPVLALLLRSSLGALDLVHIECFT